MANCNRFSCPRGENCPCRIEVAKMRAILRQIGYPGRGTAEDDWSIYDAAKAVQEQFTLEQLKLTP